MIKTQSSSSIEMVGIASHGYKHDKHGKFCFGFGTYTRVSMYVPWIKENTKEFVDTYTEFKFGHKNAKRIIYGTNMIKMFFDICKFFVAGVIRAFSATDTIDLMEKSFEYHVTLWVILPTIPLFRLLFDSFSLVVRYFLKFDYENSCNNVKESYNSIVVLGIFLFAFELLGFTFFIGLLGIIIFYKIPFNDMKKFTSYILLSLPDFRDLREVIYG